MKTTKLPTDETRNRHKLLIRALGPENICSIFITSFGMADLMTDFILEKVQNFMDAPVDVKYAIVQHLNIYRLLIKILDGSFSKDEDKLLHLPTGDGAWESEEDFEKRFIFVVGKFYEELKKEGKI